MPTVYTIGHTQKSLERFIQLLQKADVDAVIDVRLRNTSQLAGFAKRDDLAYLLREGFRIQYEHHPELAPTGEILDHFRANNDWAAYERAFLSLLAARDASGLGHDLLARHRHPCLLCAEPLPGRCHRRLVAEFWANYFPDLEVVHLT
jgi:uncharacterized protein (DUF488 family)